MRNMTTKRRKRRMGRGSYSAQCTDHHSACRIMTSSDLVVRRLHHNITAIGCTGGGAYKFSQMFNERLGITLKKSDELECLMR
jgi:pantothenate kinase